MESARRVGDVEIGAAACLGFSTSNPDVATEEEAGRDGMTIIILFWKEISWG